MQMVMTSDKTQIQIFANWPMSHAKGVTRDKRKNPEYRVVAEIRKLWADSIIFCGPLHHYVTIFVPETFEFLKYAN